MNIALTGLYAFYNQPNYEETTRKEMISPNAPQPIYTVETESARWRTAKIVFSIIIFPIGIYYIIHNFIGFIIFAPSGRKSQNEREIIFNNHYIVPLQRNEHGNITQKSQWRSDNQDAFQWDFSSAWKVKRISVEVDGLVIDGAILGKESTFANGRWMLCSNGISQLYEYSLINNQRFHANSKFVTMLDSLESNAVVFNYSGVGKSIGTLNRTTMKKAYQAMLKMLSDKENGIGATEIIGNGFSIGGGVQGDALYSFIPVKGISYVFIKNRTFSDLRTTANHMLFRPIGALLWIFGWNMGSVESSKKLQVPEIIIQTAEVENSQDISNFPEKIVHDGVVSKDASLAKTLLKDPSISRKSKYFMGVREKHRAYLEDYGHLANKVNEMLAPQEMEKKSMAVAS